MDSPLVRWHVPSSGADGLLITSEAVFAAGGENLVAYDLQTGEELWSAQIGDTSGPTPIRLDGDVISVAPSFEPVSAFDATTGAPAPPPSEPPTEVYSTFELPPGYGYDGEQLSFEGQRIWDGVEDIPPQVGRLGSLTIVNGFESGLAIVDDAGEILFQSEQGELYYDEGGVLVDEALGVAVTMTADGELWLVQRP